MKYCITDIETTGGRMALHGITEIASYITDGTQILGEFQTLVKPDGLIPRNITLLTGITNEMVENAPRFDEIADDWLNFVGDAIFIAHNVSFDLGFIQQQMTGLNKEYEPKKLCTVRLARKIKPGFPSYSLGNLCGQMGIKINGRHRAAGDAKATVELFHYLLANDKNGEIDKQLKQQKKSFAFPPLLNEQEYEKLPMDTGIYYLQDEHKKNLYIGKAKNIKQRIRSHFRTAKADLLNKLCYIDYQLTGTDLLASIIEADEIKKYWPAYNVAQKFPRNLFTITSYTNQNNEIKLAIKRSKTPELSPLFGSQYGTRVYLEEWVKENEICPRLGGLQMICEDVNCACNDIAGHNIKLTTLCLEMKQYLPSFCLIDKGRTSQEKSIIWINKGRLEGMAYTKKLPKITTGNLTKLIAPLKEHPETPSIIGKYLAEYLTSDQTTKKYISL